MSRGEASLFLFEDYILQQLLRSAVGEIPARFFYSDGLAHLQQHDESSQVSYLETLRIYLDNNMSIAKTAEDLYIHRSSLLDRLARIQQILGTDLSVPELRLSIHLVLKAEELGTEAERAQRSGVSPADG
jgi:DNA-binding PucR family transcriptional regulator